MECDQSRWRTSSTPASHGAEPIVDGDPFGSGQRRSGAVDVADEQVGAGDGEGDRAEHQAAGPGDGDVVLQWTQHVDVGRGELGVADDRRRLEGGAQQRRPVPVVGQRPVEGPQVGADVVEPAAAGEGPRPPPVRRRRVRRRPQAVEGVQRVVGAAQLGGDLGGQADPGHLGDGGAGPAHGVVDLVAQGRRLGEPASGDEHRPCGVEDVRPLGGSPQRIGARAGEGEVAVGDRAVADLVGGDEPGQVGQRAEAGREPARCGEREEAVAGGRPDRLARRAPGGPAQPQEHSRLDERIGRPHRPSSAAWRAARREPLGIDGVQLGRQRRRQLGPAPCSARRGRLSSARRDEGDGPLVDLRPVEARPQVVTVDVAHRRHDALDVAPSVGEHGRRDQGAARPPWRRRPRRGPCRAP